MYLRTCCELYACYFPTAPVLPTAARGAAKAIKQYCVRRLVDDYIVRADAAAPPLVPRPGA